jgi:hypothetical protein
MSNLQIQIQVLARSFVDQVVEALRDAPLQELFSSRGREGIAGGKARAEVAKAVASASAARKVVAQATEAPRAVRSTGRLPRRSAEEIAGTLDKIVTLVKKHKGGLRAEEIRMNLGMQAKEMPRLLKEGVSTKKLSSKGQKRATTYFAK